MLPTNLIRPQPDDFAPPWGDRPVPDHIAGVTCLEIGRRLELKSLGANITVLPAGSGGCPMHWHQFEEEVFVVLQGEVTVRELPPHEQCTIEYTLRAGELNVYPPGTGLAHHSVNRSEREARVLALSSFWNNHEIGFYPESGKTVLRGANKLGVLDGEAGDVDEARRRADVRPTQTLICQARPGWVSTPERSAERALGSGRWGRRMSQGAGATEVFVNRDRLEEGAVSNPLHWHTSDDELAVVLSGNPTLRQIREGEEERAVLQPGDIVGWVGNDRVAHQLLAEEGECEVLVIGTSRQDDITMLVEEDQMFVRALDRRCRLTPASYWAGEGE